MEGAGGAPPGQSNQASKPPDPGRNRPFSNSRRVGPGIARSYYGGLSLLFPPRTVPNAFQLTESLGLRSLTERLTFGALTFSKERNIAFISKKRPGVRLRSMAGKFKKGLVWIPLSSFSTETLNRLRHFHILNGKVVRSWATRFIGD